MDAHHPERWDAMAGRFDEAVCHVLAEDRGRVVARRLAAEARWLRERRPGRPLVAVDFGCGTGRALPLLARTFDSVIGTDVSAACLAEARVPRNASLVQADLGRPRLRLPIPAPGADLGLCINVLIMPDEDLRERILRNVLRHLRPRGRLVLVVPALESELLVRRRFREWTGSRWRPRGREVPDEGLFEVGGALTKTWTCEELDSLGAIGAETVEYSWATEFGPRAASWGPPRPFDWLAVIERRAP